MTVRLSRATALVRTQHQAGRLRAAFFTPVACCVPASAANTFEAFRKRILRPLVRHRYALAAAAEAHRDLEGRRTTGQLLLFP